MATTSDTSVDFELRHPRGRTAIRVGAGALGNPGDTARAALAGRSAFLVTTPAVRALHEPRLAELERSAAHWRVLEVPDGERAKELGAAEDLWRRLLREGGKRDSRVLAFGGGAVGDLAGFVAGAFLRGVGWLQLPTTLLAQVDAAIGGKTGVNLPEAKNSVGLFHHPAAVICDTAVLSTLDGAELRSGLFEIVKIGAIRAPELLRALDASLPRLLEADAEALTPVVAAAARCKAGIVEADPEEADQRRLLNFGHTVGHALESLLGYGDLRHGEAVGYGMLFALRLACRRGLGIEAAESVRALIRRIGLPPLGPVSAGAILERIARDKKARESGLAWVYPRALGEGYVDEAVGGDEIEALLEEFVADPWSG